MIEVKLDNIREHLTNGLIHINNVYPIRKDAHFVVDKAMIVTLSNGEEIIIQKGFEFDGSSSPRFLWWIFPSYGDFFFAAMIHDWLYVHQYMHTAIGYKEAQKFADQEMLNWSNILNNKNFAKTIDNYMRYYAVRLFGKKKYKNK